MRPLRLRHITRVLFITVVAVTSCVEPYAPPVTKANANFLVIDSFLNASDNSCRVRLTRAVPLTSEQGYAEVEENPGVPIEVKLEDDLGNFYFIPKTGVGIFEAFALPVNTQRKYRLLVNVSPGEQYESDYVEIKQTPPIEKVFFDYDDEGVRILVNSQETDGQGKYYRWTFTETFEYTAPYSSGYKIVGEDVVQREASEQIYRCYRSDASHKIMIASSNDLNSDVIRNYHLQSIPRNSQKLQHRYSINVQQFALTEDAYSYWLNLYRTTENVGGLFDPMPGEVSGNFHSTRDASRPVIGYFSGATMHEQRIFLVPQDFPEGYRNYRPPFCPIDTIYNEQIPQAKYRLLIAPVYETTGFPVIIGYLSSEKSCVDCRAIHDGVTTKPPFWPQ
jgi:hypothetical protein